MRGTGPFVFAQVTNGIGVQEIANELIAAKIRRGIDRGEFRRVDPILAARFMSSTTITHSTWCARRNVFKLLTDVTDEQVFESLSDFFFHAIRATPSATAAESVSTQ